MRTRNTTHYALAALLQCSRKSRYTCSGTRIPTISRHQRDCNVKPLQHGTLPRGSKGAAARPTAIHPPTLWSSHLSFPMTALSEPNPHSKPIAPCTPLVATQKQQHSARHTCRGVAAACRGVAAACAPMMYVSESVPSGPPLNLRHLACTPDGLHNPYRGVHTQAGDRLHLPRPMRLASGSRRSPSPRPCCWLHKYIKIMPRGIFLPTPLCT